MAYTRTTVIDATPSGDSVKQAVLDLDTDLTGAFDGINQLQAALALKINQSEYDQPGGVPRLDTSGLLKSSQLPGTAADLPIGMIAAFGMETLPTSSNWLECNGAQLAIADYQSLYTAIGNAWGLGNPGYFVLPDLRGQFVRGWDHGRGKDPDTALRAGGDHVGSSQADIMKKHSHPLGGVVGTAAGGTGVVDCQAWDNGPYNYFTGDFLHTSDKNGGSLDSMPQVAPARGNETRPTNVAVLYGIKWR